MERVRWLPVAAIVAAALAAGLWFGAGPAQPPSIPLTSSSVTESFITVHVSGAVVRPGLVELRPGSRVADAIAAAGGVTGRAGSIGVNLAATLVDGQHVVVTTTDGAGGATASNGLIHVNTADVGELQQLPGVGPVLAGRIAAYRDDHGPFGRVEDLLAVPGIGEGKLAALRDAAAVP